MTNLFIMITYLFSTVELTYARQMQGQATSRGLHDPFGNPLFRADQCERVQFSAALSQPRTQSHRESISCDLKANTGKVYHVIHMTFSGIRCFARISTK